MTRAQWLPALLMFALVLLSPLLYDGIVALTRLP
jgi:hypothetical protein